jgi:eukaryotic-like serine/threonine-protein kinase
MSSDTSVDEIAPEHSSADPVEPAKAPSPTKTYADPAEEEAAKLVGTVISERYRLVELVAVGGMGAVYKAEHLLLRKWMAIKLLRPETRDFPGHVARFEREAIAGAHIQHRNIVSATDFGKLPDGAYFLVLEYVSGVSLDRVIQEGPLDPLRAAEITRQLASALAAAHEHGVIHRDIKPRNIMLQEGQIDHIKLIDFGLAKVPLERLSTTDRLSKKPTKNAKLTLNGTVFGTVAYMAPEAGLGMDRVDERSDLYALGITLYEMLSAKHPFDATDPVKLFQQHRTVTPPPLKLRTPGINVPRKLEAVVMRLLQKDPGKRFENAGALIAALDTAVPRPKAGGTVSWKSPLPPSVAGALVPRQTDSIAFDPSGLLPALGSPDPSGPQRSSKPLDGGPDLPTSGGAAAKVWPLGQGARTSGYEPRLRPPRRRVSARVWTIGASIGLVAGVLVVLVLFRFSPSSKDLAPIKKIFLPASQSASARAQPSGTASAKASATLVETAAPPEGSAPDKPAASPEQERFIYAAKSKDWVTAETTMQALVEKEPAVFRERDVRLAAAEVAVRAAFRADAAADKVFDTLTNKLGPEGLDILYEVVSAHGGTKGAERSSGILRRPEVLARASPALRIAMELRAARCEQVSALFGRAESEGDVRAIVVLDLLRSQPCRRSSAQCCLYKDATIDRTVRAMRQRLRK